MRINKGYNNFKIDYIQSQYKSDVKKETDGTNKKLKRDSVDISEEGKVLLEQMKAVETDERLNRVEEIKQAIEDDSYEIDSKKIASGMIDRLLGQRGSEIDE